MSTDKDWGPLSDIIASCDKAAKERQKSFIERELFTVSCLWCIYKNGERRNRIEVSNRMFADQQLIDNGWRVVLMPDPFADPGPAGICAMCPECVKELVDKL